MARNRPDDQDNLDGIPTLDEAPVVWDATRREFVPKDRSIGEAPSEKRSGRRHVVVPAPVQNQRPSASPAAGPANGTPPKSHQGTVGGDPNIDRVAGRARPQGPRPPARPTTSISQASSGGAARSRRWPKIVVAAVLIFSLMVGGVFGFGWWRFSKISRVDVASALSTGQYAGTNYLIVGTDSREGIAANDVNAGAFLDGETGGARTDTIMVMRIEKSGSAMLSIPRDLWVENPTTGEMGRINSTYATGPATLITAVQNLGIPIHHYLEVNFVTFGRIVDAVGGIAIEFPYPARDTHSGLDIPTAGIHNLDGTQALAYVRSRYYEELIDGVWRSDPLSDLSRVKRQRSFIAALLTKATHTWNPVVLARVGNSGGTGLKIDSKLTYFQAISLGWRLRGFDPESLTLPVIPRTTSGGAAVLDLDSAQAAPIVERFSR